MDETNLDGNAVAPADTAPVPEPQGVDLDDAITKAMEGAGLPDGPKVAKPGKEPVAATETPADGQRAAPGVTEPKPGEKPLAAPEAPQHWPAQRRETFAKLPPDAQRAMLDMARDLEAGFTKNSSELADDRKLAQGIRALISDGHRAQMQRSGLSEIDGIGRLLQLNDFATRDTPGYVRWVAQQAGLRPEDVFPQLAGQDGHADPAQPQDLTQQLGPFLQPVYDKLDQWERERQETTRTTIRNALRQFREAKDESGNPAHVYLPRVEADLVRILTTPDIASIPDYGERLSRAYELAIYANPDVRKEVMEAEFAKREAEKLKQADTAKAQRAKPAVSQMDRAPNGQFRGKQSLDDIIERAAADAGLH